MERGSLAGLLGLPSTGGPQGPPVVAAGGVVTWSLRYCAGFSLVASGGRLYGHVGGSFLAAAADGGAAARHGTAELETRQPLVLVDGVLLSFCRTGQVLGMDLVDGVD